MILDGQLLFTGGSTPPGSGVAYADNVLATGASSTNVIDLAIVNTAAWAPPSQTSPSTQPFRDLGIGDDPAMKILVQAIGTGWAPGTATLTVALQGAPDNGSGGQGSYTTMVTMPAAVLGSTINTNGGARLMDMDVPRPPAGMSIPRFLKLLYTVASGPFTGTTNYLLGTIVLDRADQIYNATNNVIWGGYAPGITVAN